MPQAVQGTARVVQQPLEYDFAGGVVLLSSEQAGWSGIASRYYRAPAMYRETVPAFGFDSLAIQVKGVTPLTSRITQSQRSVLSVPGDIYLVPKGEASSWYSRDSCELLHLYATTGLFRAVALQTADLDPQRVELIARVQERDPLIYQLGLAFLDELRTGGALGRLYVDSLAQLLIVHLLRQHAGVSKAVPDPSGGLARAALRRVLDYIGDNLAHDLSLEAIAAVAGVSPYHFTRLFKQSVGQTLHRYVIQQRLSEAKRLLLAGRNGIADVAHLTGFADQSHLHRHFKMAYGITPGALLEQRKNLQAVSKNRQDSDGTIE